MDQSVTVAHSRGSYEVEFAEPKDWREAMSGDARLIVDENVARLWPEETAFGDRFIVPSGEQSKSFAMVERICRWLAETKATRRTTVVCLGGGVVGDLGGFAAAVALRGLKWVQVPTTLLAMVDSSVGGKVGIDLPEGKNLVGSFWPPEAVIVCPGWLETLPLEEFLNGTAEVWKAAYLEGGAMVQSLRQSPMALGDDRLVSQMRQAIAYKAMVVSADEFETKGLRSTLNLGHTVGHAVESASGFRLAHGCCVAIGMVAEARLAERLGFARQGLAAEIEADIAVQGLPTAIPDDQSPDLLVELMGKDKKRENAGLAFALLEDIGRCKLVTEVEPDVVRQILCET